jgi:hypothetical protein
MTIVDIQTSLTLANVNNGKCLFQYRDKDLIIKTLCAIVGQFNASLNVTTDKMSGGDIYECAVLLSEYTHDRFEDLILCLKNVKKGLYGKIYNRVDTQVILEFWKQYLEEKSKFTEAEYKEHKSKIWESRTETDTMIIANERKLETERERLQRIALSAQKEIRGLKDMIRNQTDLL